MSKIIPALDAIRIIPRDAGFLNRRVGSRGEIFLDSSDNALRVFSGNDLGGYSIAKTDLSNINNAIFAAKAEAAGVGGGNTTVTVSDEAPESPESGNLWLNTDNGKLYVYVSDDDNDQWIQPAVPAPDLTGYATEDYVDSAVEGIDFRDIVGGTGITIDETDPAQIEIIADFAELVDDTTPQLGGDLDVNSFTITGLSTPTENDEAVPKSYVDTEISDAFGGIEISGTSITSDDSSEISFVPTVRFNSDLIVDNDLVVNNSVRAESFETTSTGIPRITSETNFDLVVENTVRIIADKSQIFGLALTTESFGTKTGATGTVDHNLQDAVIWYHSSLAANFTVNFTNVPTTNNRVINIALILDQGGTARVPIAAQIDGSAVTIKWEGAAGTPSGNNNQTDLVSFTLIRQSDTWSILAGLSTFD